MNHAPSIPYGLHAGFLMSTQRHPDRLALDVSGQQYSYAQLHQRAAAQACVLTRHRPGASPARVGVLASRSLPVYAGLLGGLMAGLGVVPLNPGFPVERTRQMIELAGLGALVVDTAGQAHLPALLQGLTQPLLICLPGSTVDTDLQAQWPQHLFLAMADAEAQAGFQPISVSPDALAYLFFTSGSTGAPKGVGVLHRNVVRFVEMSVERYRAIGLSEQDRFSQFYDITFDSSMFDLYVCWAFGGCLCCPTQMDWVNPNKFIESKALTVIDIVPSTGHSMNRSNGWREGRFQALRLCRFGGEALSADLAAALAAAAPAAQLDNVYGPTECTVDAAYYQWHRERSAAECVHGVVPIGVAGPQVGLMVVDSSMQQVAEGAEGELLISGPQVTPGYWNSPERTAAAFVALPGADTVYYRTGDLVRRPLPGQPIPYLGRLDFQIKISGVRIELGEVEQALRQAAGTDLAVAVGWPVTTSGASGIVAFIVKVDSDLSGIRRQLKETLPSVMVPRDIHVIAELPLNVNGKVDRKALLARLQVQQGQT